METKININAIPDSIPRSENFKTINGESILGSGDLTIESGAKIYEWFYDGESESVTLSQEEYDNIVEAAIVVVNFGGVCSVAVSKTGKEFSEAMGRYSLVGQIAEESGGIELYININIEISTKVAKITLEQQEILTKTSQLENDSNFVTSNNIKTINGESILGSGDITISGGGSSGGSGAYPEIDGSIYKEEDMLGNWYNVSELMPNTFYVFPECGILDITAFGPETSGVANEYLFQFTSGATATTLTLPDDIKWANDSAPTIAENKIYQVSILKGLASVLEFDNAPSVALINFTIRGISCIATEGMTWEQWVSSEYNTINCSLVGNNVQRLGEIVGTSYTSYVTKTDVITSDFAYVLIPMT